MMGGLLSPRPDTGAQLTQHADITYTFILALYLANVMMLCLAPIAHPISTIVTGHPSTFFQSVYAPDGHRAYALRGNVSLMSMLWLPLALSGIF